MLQYLRMLKNEEWGRKNNIVRLDQSLEAAHKTTEHQKLSLRIYTNL